MKTSILFSLKRKNKERILDYFFPGEMVKMDEKKKNNRPQLRNFFAHSGLLSNMMEFNLQKDLIRYKESERATVKDFLIKLSSDFK